MNEHINDFNTIISFLALRDINELSSEALFSRYGIKQADLLMILGSGIPYIAEVGARAFNNNLAKELMIVGGIGHSTKYLIDNVIKCDKYKGIEAADRAEADILKDIIVRNEKVDGARIIVENKSTNCGSNAYESLRIIKGLGKAPKSVILIQDPTMQLRSSLNFKKEWNKEGVTFINYAPFIPLLKEVNEANEFIQDNINGLWDIDRFIALVMGEIPRLMDDENGYGPKGKGYIEHVDLPMNVIKAYENLKKDYSDYIDVRNAGTK